MDFALPRRTMAAAASRVFQGKVRVGLDGRTAGATMQARPGQFPTSAAVPHPASRPGRTGRTGWACVEPSWFNTGDPVSFRHSAITEFILCPKCVEAVVSGVRALGTTEEVVTLGGDDSKHIVAWYPRDSSGQLVLYDAEALCDRLSLTLCIPDAEHAGSINGAITFALLVEHGMHPIVRTYCVVPRKGWTMTTFPAME